MKVYLKAAGITLATFLVLLAAFVYWKNSTQPTQSLNLVQLHEKMEKEGLPSFSATTIDGRPIQLDHLRGKLVIVNFWATWCSPCLEEVPSLIKLVKEYQGKIEVLAISQDSSIDDINVFLKSFPEFANRNIHIVFDSDRSLSRAYGVTGLPESYLADKNTRLIKKIVGSINWYTPDSVQYIAELLGK